MDRPLGLNELAARVGAEPDFLRRMLRLLAANGIINESTDEVYSLSRLSAAFARDPSMRAAVSFYLSEVLAPAHAKLPEYARTRGYSSPKAGDEVWNFVTGEDKTFYRWLHEQPEKVASWQCMLTGHASDRPTWTQFYPTGKLIKTWREGTPLIVDVGGGQGQDLKTFIELHRGEIKGGLVLQDLPDVIEGAKSQSLDPAITAMAHDFFTEQLVKGARVYYLHYVLLNWPDDKAVQILENLKPALTPGYSQILINDNVCIPGASHLGVVALDVAMMSVFNARNKTKGEWEAIVQKAGLRIKSILSIPEIVESVIVVESPED